jgi:hypothetical protein
MAQYASTTHLTPLPHHNGPGELVDLGATDAVRTAAGRGLGVSSRFRVPAYDRAQLKALEHTPFPSQDTFQALACISETFTIMVR